MKSDATIPLIAIACGGTGGHLFPGLAVAEELVARGCEVSLLISPKEVDQQAIKGASDFQIEVLPAVALNKGRMIAFLKGFWKSYSKARKLFREQPPRAVLAMGGFTSAPPVLAARAFGAKAFLHEANSIPGRANRWLTHWVDEAFVYFFDASGRLNHRSVQVSGMPVRPQFQPMDAASCRMAMGLHPQRPVLLTMGGSQGASGVNKLVTGALPVLTARVPDLQFIHLTGPNDTDAVRAAYEAAKARAIVLPFLTEMELAMGAATASVSRAGASSLAELAALGLPAVLIPYPHAADNHQLFNARAFVESGAARFLDQTTSASENLAEMVVELVTNHEVREGMREGLAKWHFPDAAAMIAGRILERIGHELEEPNMAGASFSRARAALPR